MALRFNIENETNLPDGGPVSFTVTGKRIVDIGRDRHLDWTLAGSGAADFRQALRSALSGWRLLAARRLDQRNLSERRRSAHARTSQAAQWRSAYRRTVHHRRFLDFDRGQAGRREAEMRLPRRPKLRRLCRALERRRAMRRRPSIRQQLKVPREAARPVNPEFLDWAASVPDPDARPARRAPFASRQTIRTRPT